MQIAFKIDKGNTSEVRFEHYCSEKGYDVSDIDFALAIGLMDEFCGLLMGTEEAKEALRGLIMSK